MASAKVGQDIEDICTRCGDTWHVVVAKIGERVAKVICKLCNTQHSYRGEKNAPEKTSTGGSWGSARKRKSMKRAAPVAEIPTPTFDPSKPPRAYSFKDAYNVGERMNHPTFGVGVVATAPGPGKVEVVFPAGPRTLACAKIESTLERPVAVKGVPISDRPPEKT